MTSAPWLELSRTVRFSDTDAAGVMHFQQLLGWCHQAWEESLERFGLPAGTIFPGGREGTPGIALPIVHCDAEFRAPLQMGDVVLIQLEPKRLDRGSFEVVSRYLLGENEVARGCLRHVAIDAASRRRCPLPDGLERWLEESGLGQINPL
ncbi:thioesterase family protein [Synechococcus sp. RS9902]|uniref:acyl-CoA thioesterase n=1 Tax=Synechococcus sp. RS9902 TaxID=221345 RepID=UPI00164902BE|nr:acyl-CoA thioesterase [Synechococcus sp. RS9902]QNI98614.1 1/4-dihydroxy-2-naphthoyl-CoA hydrolase [Synechococcus sp. RS9902]